MRRVLKRMHSINIETFAEYLDFLTVHPDEFSHLFNTVLINVTSFFRDKPAWDYINSEILPDIIANSKDKPIRVWCAGVASGQEACSIAILLSEALGNEFSKRVKIYATDIDEEALDQARQAIYARLALDALSDELKQKYFLQQGENYVFKADIRRGIIFGRHDLVQDPPISHLDLLICRNTLMYMNAETQAKIINKFHFALKDTGYLFLGKAEMLLSYSDFFQQSEMKHRIFCKVKEQSYKGSTNMFMQIHELNSNGEMGTLFKLRELCFDKWHTPHLVIDTSGTIILVNDKARHSFGLTQSDIGKSIQDLEISYRPVELRSLIERASSEKKTVHMNKVSRHQSNGQEQYFDVEITPLIGNDLNLTGTSIIFTEVTGYYKIHEELQRANQELETTNEELQSAHEELETTNEELQSTNEELETTNEELQSTNEELETMNEELHSTNEELETTNSELRTLTQELDRSNSFLSSILTSLRSAVIVMDKNLNISVWNHRCEDLWGLRSNEVMNKNFFDLDIGLPVEELRDYLFTALKTQQKQEELILTATNRRGKIINCKIRAMPLHLNDHLNSSEGLVFSIDEVEAS
jgi:two-component system CheB/CheR fusion protein